MQITIRTCYSTMALLEMARVEEVEPVSIEAIARRQQIPRARLRGLFKRLRSAGLVRGVRGARGGYVLARRPEETSLLDVVAAVEARTRVSEWLANQNAHLRSRRSATSKMMGQLDESMSTMFESISLADLGAAREQAARRTLANALEGRGAA